MRLAFSNHLDISICLILFLTSGFLYVVSTHFQNASGDMQSSSWLFRLLSNLSGYGVIFVPGYLIIKYIYRTNYVDKTPKGFLWPLIKTCIYGPEGEQLLSSDTIKQEKIGQDRDQSLSTTKTAWLLLYCFAGLMGSYLVWGLLQEKIMTQRYDGESFKDSQFLVFVNRVLALIISWAYLRIYERGKVREAPLYKYSYCALSNIMSSWLQYEALKFVSFPTQVLAKACKIIPVMLMGKVISNQKYEFYEYFTATLISFGMVLFLSGSSDSVQAPNEATGGSITATGLSGIIILISYMVFDSFTSNWQNELFKTYKMSSVRMMAGVNLFSCLLTGVSLVQQGTLTSSLYFMLDHKSFFVDCVILSFTSAIGQLYIYFTIEKFGAVIFITIMTIRQAIAVLMSCILYSHPITAVGIIGVSSVFVSVFLRIYCSYRMKQLRKVTPPQPSLSSSIAKV